ncbi:GNAT family N-acetyltransferase [Granulicoccus sp. GXG6511]|uniref:GNAT family N-acetyltransferase n=1 Tax=Granulicoccus sp. GXG6511 TaxID=3381351 RepID=UPI003D7CE54C
MRAHVAAQIATYAPIMPRDYAATRHAEAPAAAKALETELTEMHAVLAGGHEPFRRHWVAERGLAEHTRIIGIACAGTGPNWWEAGFDPPPADVTFMLDRLYVLPAEHGTGAGQALFDVAVGARSAYLWILRNNPRAERFYRRNGFVPDGSVGPAGGPWLGRPMFRMIRRLPIA